MFPWGLPITLGKESADGYNQYSSSELLTTSSRCRLPAFGYTSIRATHLWNPCSGRGAGGAWARI